MARLYEVRRREVQKNRVGGNYDPVKPQDDLISDAAGGQHGWHPNLVNEFLKSILEDRRPAVDEVLGGNITAAGICAHISAMKDGAEVVVPEF